MEYLITPYKLVFYKAGFIKINPYQNFVDNSCVNNPRRASLVAKHLVNNWFVAYQIAKSNNASSRNSSTYYIYFKFKNVGKN